MSKASADIRIRFSICVQECGLKIYTLGEALKRALKQTQKFTGTLERCGKISKRSTITIKRDPAL